MAVGLPDESSDVSVSDLRRLTNELIDRTRRLLRRCKDEDIAFVPEDPYAFDPGAATDHEANMAWTLGHIIVHMTASSEEFAAVAAELARGVAYHGRSRHEVPWEGITTAAQCYARLEESRHIRLASLGMWPGSPHLENVFVPWEGAPELGPAQVYLFGMKHEFGHLDQVRAAAAQARTFRLRTTRLGRVRLWWGAHAGVGEAVGMTAGTSSQRSGLL
jgi:hypothetical protein